MALVEWLLPSMWVEPPTSSRWMAACVLLVMLGMLFKTGACMIFHFLAAVLSFELPFDKTSDNFLHTEEENCAAYDDCLERHNADVQSLGNKDRTQIEQQNENGGRNSEYCIDPAQMLIVPIVKYDLPLLHS